MVQGTLATNSEIWNRNIDLLNILTYGDLTGIAGQQRGSIRQLESACYVKLTTIGPLYYDKERTEHTNKKTGEVIISLGTIKGIHTDRFKQRYNDLNLARRFILASENEKIAQGSRYFAAQRAWEILNKLYLDLAQDAEDLGLNKKDKIPGAAAALTGT
jgi:hypothetical protein